MKTRDKILATALKLFNELGVSNVTLRQIAATMYISQGNLNYHFKHREDIIEALFIQLTDAFEQEKNELQPEKMDFQYLIDSTKRSMERLYNYRFLMLDLNQNIRKYPKIVERFKELENVRKQTTLLAFNMATQAGVMRAQAFDKEYEGLNERIRVFHDYWIASAEVYDETMDGVVDKYHNLLVEMFFAYFSREAQREFLLKRL